MILIAYFFTAVRFPSFPRRFDGHGTTLVCFCLQVFCLCVYMFVSFSELLPFADVHVPFLQVHCPTGPKQVQAGTMGQWKAVFFWMTGGIKIYDGKSPCSWI